MVNLFDLSGEVVAVIGATGVLGGAIAEGLAAAGARVAGLGRNLERGQARVSRINEAGGQAEFFVADVMTRESLAAARDALEARWGGVTVLVNAAGGNDPRVTVTPERPFEAIEAVDWRA